MKNIIDMLDVIIWRDIGGLDCSIMLEALDCMIDSYNARLSASYIIYSLRSYKPTGLCVSYDLSGKTYTL